MPHLGEHFDVVFGTGFQPFSLKELPLRLERFQTGIKFLFNPLNGVRNGILRHNKVLCRINRKLFVFLAHISGQRAKAADTHNLFPVKLDAVGFFHICREYFHHIALYTEAAALQHRIVPLILQTDQLLFEFTGINGLPFFYGDA